MMPYKSIELHNIFLYLLYLNKAALYNSIISGQSGISSGTDLVSMHRHNPAYDDVDIRGFHNWHLQVENQCL